MADEKRRLIYELLVQAVGLEKQTAQAQTELNALGSVVEKVGGVLKVAGIGAGLYEIGHFAAEAVGDLVKLNEQLGVLGLHGAAAAEGIEAIEKTAIRSGQTIGNVAQAYKSALLASRAMGGGQKEAAELTEAFTRSMIVQGRTAADAAAELKSLAFAMERGAVKGKEFNSILKEDPLLLEAATQALGVTSQELIKMGEAGQITKEKLQQIIAQYEALASQQKVGDTLDRIAQSFKDIAEASVSAVAGASGLLDVMSEGKGLSFMDKWANVAIGIERAGAGLGRIGSNLGQLGYDVGKHTVLGVLDMFSDEGLQTKGRLNEFFSDWTEDLEDIRKGYHAITGEIEDAEQHQLDMAAAADNVKKFWQQAVGMETPYDFSEPGRVRTAGSTRDPKKVQEERDAKAAKDAADAQKAAREQQAYDIAILQDQEEQRNKTAKDYADLSKENLKWIDETYKENEKNLDVLMASKALMPAYIAEWEKFWLQFEQYANVVEQTFTQLFSGGISNAREFFRVLMQGFAQVAAQAASKELTEYLVLFAKGLFGGSTGTAAPPHIMGPYASGGIVDSPSVFSTKSAGIGLMGEAGPEAIMPVQRMRDGKLGVGAVVPNIQIINHTGVPARASVSQTNDRLAIVLEAANMGANLAEERINRSMRAGYGSTAQSLQRTYGLKRRV